MGSFLLLFLLAMSACTEPNAGKDGEQPSTTGFQAALQADGRYRVLVSGQTMGTTYHATYFTPSGSEPVNHRPAIDSLLEAFNACLSTYDSSSVISRWNRSPTGDVAFDGDCGVWAKQLHVLSQNIWDRSEGAFDPTIMPLVRYWGFFQEDPFAGEQTVDSSQVADLLRSIGYGRVLDPDSLASAWFWRKNQASAALDFNAVAKGLGVDVIADWLRAAGHRNALVEIGGEVVTIGRNAEGKPWRIALEKPLEESREFHAVLHLQDAAMATSGNYRSFWERDGQRYGHSLNPLTGYPERTRLLSATCVAPDCATADAWATACMVMGLERSLAVLEKVPGVEAYLLYLEDGDKGEAGLAAMQTAGFAAKTAE